MKHLAARRSMQIKALAAELGFAQCGIATAGFLKDEALGLERWLKKGYHGSMQYMEKHFDKRLDPRRLVHGARSVISLLYNYAPQKKRQGGLQISTYAYGEDYHFVLKRKLKTLLEGIRSQVGHVEGRVFVDSGPVHERAWAQRAGIAWIGKHTLAIHKQKGSFFFLAQIISDLPLEADAPATDHCGTCTRCLDACPTQAILPGRVLDARKCISYLTIETKKAIPSHLQKKLDGWIFGCDICQDVCPWNRFAVPHEEPAFQPSPAFDAIRDEDFKALTREAFQHIFRRSALKRAGYDKLKENIKAATKG